MFSEQLDEVLARTHSKHIAGYNTKYDGKGGIAWKDDGGILCSCDWHHPPTDGWRPWQQWHTHVATEVIKAFIGALVDEEEPGALEFDAMRNVAARTYRSDYDNLPPAHRLLINVEMQGALMVALKALIAEESVDARG